ncbi:MAG: AraC family transcriptional regulator [Eubacteriales bacterium]|nr:AraC family transcriptional regulator [Eubacteriales bacterium]
MGELSLNRDGKEQLTYIAHGFPVRSMTSYLSLFQQYAAACHWHMDFEWLCALEGEIDYRVSGETIHLLQGQAIFVNSNRLHYGYSAQHHECVYHTLLFHPSVLGEPPLPTAVYAASMAADGQKDYYLITPERDADMLVQIDTIRRLCEQRPAQYEFEVQAACCRLAALTYRALAPAAKDAAVDPAWSELRRMTGYVQQHYDEPITLAAIAAAGAMCRSKCCRLFRERLGTTPLEYLTTYRLEKACGLLRQGLSVTDTAQACGFNSISYFSETFRKVYQQSPSAYRGQC